MLTPEQRELLRRHLSIDGDGNVVGNDNTVRVTRQAAGDYAVQIGEQRITFNIAELRRVLNIKESQVGIAGDNATVYGDINFVNAVTSPWVIGLALVGIVLLSIIALPNLPDVRERLQAVGVLATNTPTPLPFLPEAEGEVLIVIAQFHYTEGHPDTTAQDEIKRAIKDAGNLNLRVEVDPTCLKADDREGAQALGDRYDASLVVWGADTGVRVTVNFYNRKQPDLIAADVQLTETDRTYVAKPKAYNEFITEDLPNQVTFLSLFALGQYYYVEQAYAESVQVMEKAVGLLAEEPAVTGAAEAYFHLGWLHQVPLEDLNQAIADYDRAIELNPQDAIAYNNRGIAYADQGDYENAIENFDSAIRLGSDISYYNRGNAYRHRGELDLAISDYITASTRVGEYASYAVYYHLGLTYAQSQPQQHKEAIEAYGKAIDQAPEMYPDFYQARARSHFTLGEHGKALEDLTVVIDQPGIDDQDKVEAYTNRGVVHTSLGQYAQALEDYQNALELNPDYAIAYYNVGATKSLDGDGNGAVEALTKAVELDPSLAHKAARDSDFESIKERPELQDLIPWSGE